MKKRTINVLMNLIVILVGILLVLIGIIWNPVNPDYVTFIIGIGSSILATGIVALLTYLQSERREVIFKMIEEWGLNSIFSSRGDANSHSIDAKFKKLSKQVDVMAFGLDHFRNSKSKAFEDKLRKNKDLQVRILTLNPNSQFVTQREKDENRNIGSIKKSIEDLIEWVEQLNKKCGRDDIQIKFYDTLPLYSYLRIDDIIYTGPHEYNKISSQSITYEFDAGGKGFSYYSEYFEDIWSNSDLCKVNLTDYEKKLPSCDNPDKAKTCNKFFNDGLVDYYTSYSSINNTEVAQQITNAKLVRLIEVYSDRNVKEYFIPLKSMLKNNGKLEVLIFNSSNTELDGFRYLNNKFIEGNGISNLKENGSKSVIDNSKLIGEIKRLQDTVGMNKDNINVYYTDYIPQYSAIIIDNIAYVVLYQTAPGRNTEIPAFKVIKQGQSNFYDFIVQDFEKLTSSAKTVKEKK